MDRRAPAAAPPKRPDRADGATGPPQEEERRPPPGLRATLRDGSDGDAGDRNQRRHAPDAFTVNAWTQVGRSGDPAIRRSGDPAIRRSGDPAIRRSGDPAIRRSGDPAIRRSGDPAIRRSGDPAIRRSGDPAIRRSGDPAIRLIVSETANRLVKRILPAAAASAAAIFCMLPIIAKSPPSKANPEPPQRAAAGTRTISFIGLVPTSRAEGKPSGDPISGPGAAWRSWPDAARKRPEP